MLTDREILAQHWEKPEALKLLEGNWPEWTDDAGHPRRLQRVECKGIPEGCYYIAEGPLHRPTIYEGYKETLCILREHVLAVLRKRWHAVDVYLGDRMCSITVYESEDGGGDHFILDTYDAALLAGLAAAQNEGESK